MSTQVFILPLFSELFLCTLVSLLCVQYTSQKKKILTEKKGNIIKLDIKYNYIEKNWKEITKSNICVVRMVEL